MFCGFFNFQLPFGIVAIGLECMPRLYLKEYGRAIDGKEVFIACREGVLRDHFQDIITDVKFLVRNGARTTLLHNLPNRFANRQWIDRLARRLPATEQVRISPEVDFHAAVLNHRPSLFKVIFLERRYLIDSRGHKINALTTGRLRQSLDAFRGGFANVNLKGALECICSKIEAGQCDRVHILPAGKHTIKHELFTVEGSGSLIANNFTESFRQVRTDEDVAMVHRILTMYIRSGYLQPRSKTYLSKNRQAFFVTAIDGIVVGCVEKKIIDDRTVEMGALAISTRFRNQRVGVHTVKSFIAQMQAQGYTQLISLTNNPRLEALYARLGFAQESPREYRQRQAQSPNVKMYFRKIDR